jgi:hypothetical protein
VSDILAYYVVQSGEVTRPLLAVSRRMAVEPRKRKDGRSHDNSTITKPR